MKVGKDTGSLVNSTLAALQKQPQVGDPCTILSWSDRNPGTIVKVTAKQVHVQYDTYERTDKNGLSESQEYTYSRNPDGMIEVFRLNKYGRWKSKGGRYLSIGRREKYHDFSF